MAASVSPRVSIPRASGPRRRETQIVSSMVAATRMAWAPSVNVVGPAMLRRSPGESVVDGSVAISLLK